VGRALEAAPKGGVLDDVVGGAGQCPPGLRRPGGGDRAVASRAGEGDIAIGGATLAAEAAALGLIDEYRAMVYPVLVGGGIPFFPQRERRVDLDLVETRTLVQESSTSATAWRAGRSPALDLKEPDSAACCCLSCHRAECNLMF
jgi:hypothetical protein